MRRALRGSRAIVTGASSGIGAALAAELAHKGVRQLLIARRAERLSELAQSLAALGTPVELLVGDITDPAIRARAIERASELWGGIDLLINNAGVGAVGPFASASPDRLRQVMEVNFFAAAEMIRLALPALRQSKRGMVVNVSSILGHRAIPRMSEYCASKFALQGLSESLRAELKAEGVDVLVVSPGSTESEFLDNVLDRQGPPTRRAARVVTSAEVAAHTVRAIELGRHEIIPSFSARLVNWANRISPRLLDRVLAERPD